MSEEELDKKSTAIIEEYLHINDMKVSRGSPACSETARPRACPGWIFKNAFWSNRPESLLLLLLVRGVQWTYG